jgi:uncharacterized protein (TIGR02996 family)
MIERELEQARVAMATENWGAALDVLLAGWLARRAPRIADVIDRVSSRLPHEPVRGKTVKARTESWLALAGRRSPRDVGSILATPWPKKWQDCVPLVEALGGYPDDPRIAVALASIVQATPTDSWASIAFYRPLLALIGRIRDPRTKPMLAADLAKAKTRFWDQRQRPVVQSTHDALDEAPMLESLEEAALARLEAFFASEVKAEQSSEKNEADFLAAIYAAPDDDTPRAVYADWLTERGDPRGEFITLQLSRSEATRKRENALLKKHGRAWAGELDRVVDKEGRVFRRGFLTEVVVLRDPTRDGVPQVIALPEWQLVATIAQGYGTYGFGRALPTAPWLGRVRALWGVAEPYLAKYVSPSLELIHFDPTEDPSPEILEVRARLSQNLPRLKQLGLGVRSGTLASYLAQPLPPSVDRLIVVSWAEAIGDLARVLEDAKVSVAVLEHRREHYARGGQVWSMELRPDASGRYTRLRAVPLDDNLPIAHFSALQLAITSVPGLTELVVLPARGCTYSADEIATLESAMAERRSLEKIDVPWARG